ncbi:poly-gamma-glutamate synthase PgsB [candidate division WOR-3 bacterium]|nr:poly-gamma-glutamate synthase PgsB [candidate division WOR-3 bacterium]
MSILIGLYVLFLRIEKVNHEKRVKSIPIRIWVNGSRGKSSVTRLIAAGLRGGGKRVIAKTTGTKASYITDNRSEQPVTRLGMANIREQVEIFKKAVAEKPEAIVLECMALRPDLQYSEAAGIVKPSVVVITNVRADHLDVMGPSVKDVGRYLLNSIPQNAMLFLGDESIVRDHGLVIRTKGGRVRVSNEKEITDLQINGFPYIEHKANVALALEVCRYHGVGDKDALNAMRNATPDPGVLRRHSVRLGDKRVTIVNAMAANDPDSTFVIWQMIDKNFSELNILINCRDDRIDRSFQMADLIRDRLQGDRYILTGRATGVLARKLRRIVDRRKILDLGDKDPVEAVSIAASRVADESLIFAMGNTVGYGEELMEQFLTKRGFDATH